MIPKTKQLVKFAPRGNDSFHDAIRQRVDAYFSSRGISAYSNGAMKLKTAAMLLLYFGPFILIVSGLTAGMPWLFYGMWALMGIGIAGIGTSVMHDANHGAYSDNKTVNKLLGGLLNLLGGYDRTWRIQHNVLHHTYTNLEGLDEDLEGGMLLRMSPDKEWKPFHRFQHIYCWPLYMLMNLYWVFGKDIKKTLAYGRNGLLQKEKISLKRALTELALIKGFYLLYVIGLPILFSGMGWGAVALGFVLMHAFAGFMLACIFQPAHVVPEAEYPEQPADRRMQNNWAVHQLLNTSNFAMRNPLVTWFVGGLNFQIEHHLFPQICHIHYPKLSRIVQETAREYGLPYHYQPTFTQAIYQHGVMLYRLGAKPQLSSRIKERKPQATATA